MYEDTSREWEALLLFLSFMEEIVMKATLSKVDKLLITGIDGLDPIVVYFEDYEKGKGKFTIECWGQAWSHFWPGMGDRTVLEFFYGCNADYILGKIMEQKLMYVTDVEATIVVWKTWFLESRVENNWTKEEAREMWDDHMSNLDDCNCEDELVNWVNNIDRDMEDTYSEWWEGMARKLSSDAEWLKEKIIPAIWDAIKHVYPKTGSKRS
jgi:hypothetical protein